MFSDAPRYRPLVAAIADGLHRLLPEGAKAVAESAKIVIFVDDMRNAIYLGQDISDTVTSGLTLQEAVRFCALSMLEQVQDMISRKRQEPWPKGQSASDFLMPDVQLEGGRLLMWFGERGRDSPMVSIDLPSPTP